MADISASEAASPDRGGKVAAFFATPLRGLLSISALQLVLWTLVPALLNKTPPTDTLEGYMWGRQWVPMTYKHPQMPAWALEITHDLTGSYTWGHFMLSQIFICATFVMVYLMARDMVGKRGALASVLLLPTLAVFSWGTRQFNHDVAQMPFWVAVSWLLWRASRDNKMGWWVALGLVSGISLYAKFSMGLIMLFGALWLCIEPQARKRWATAGPWVALAIIAVFSVTVIYNIVQLHFLPVTYADGRDGWVLNHRGRFYYIGVQVMLLLILPIALYASGMLRRAKDEPAGFDPRLLGDRRARVYLLWMGAGPPLLLALASPFTGVGEAWSKPMYSLLGLIAVAYLGNRLTDRVLRRVAGWSVGVLLFGVVTYAIFVPVKCYVTGDLNNACVPGPTIGARLQQIWHEQEHQPLGIVAGDGSMMMTAGVFASDLPSMFTDFNFAYSPWITPSRIARQGMMVIWANAGPPPPGAAPWVARRKIDRAKFPWAKGRPPLTVSYVIVPPKSKGKADTAAGEKTATATAVGTAAGAKK
ncbi:MAG: glycosyltransferase family 39 protein [Allgaiera sp.]|jgi:hypothetical protein|nr:glycosyltransferase family 39 protein [Allgaiera sp.]